MDNSFLKPVVNIIDESRVFLDEKLDNVKLRTVKGLSQGTSALAGLLVIFAIVSVLLLMLSFAFVLWLGELMNSYALAAFIVAGVLLLAVVVCLLLRKKLFRNSFVGMYSEILNPKEKSHSAGELDQAIENSQERILDQEVNIKCSLADAKQFYTPSHLLNEGLRKAGVRSSSQSGFSFGRMLGAGWRLLTHKKK